MNVSDTVQPAADLLDALGPWGILVGALVTLIGPKLLPLVARLGPAAVALYTLALGLFKRKPPAAPTPATPAVEPSPAKPDHPLLDSAMSIIRMAALARFPWLSVEEALVEYAKEHVTPRSPQAVEDLAQVTAPPFAPPVPAA